MSIVSIRSKRDINEIGRNKKDYKVFFVRKLEILEFFRKKGFNIDWIFFFSNKRGYKKFG